MTDKKKLRKYLQQNADNLNVRSIQREAGLAEGTLRKFISGERCLSDEAMEKLLPVIRKLGFK